ncbi:hypothetical protein DACRYDRAFT_53615 [Dacryopinax primogenitus]|uniref:Peptidase M48 domain-containing protein n=1 Tax=Dacryopinax primogenitus (strain DJM 731) TaxID=1858805 RepID=M5FU05_DACPD|nr:uncharacterized protein DACRYDRAFT_53615 [Dacryopinax primogenitus]EJU01161.1 hypothetical protein DACRYDRAFT_53615 [Dacryopinax primogenitus]
MSDWRVQLGLVAGAGGGVYYVSHLEEVPQTGRYRFMDLSPEAEAEYAAESFREIMNEVGPKLLPSNHPIVRYCQAIAARIVSSAGLGHVVPGSTHGVQKRRRGWGLSGLDEGETGFGNQMTDESTWEIFVINDPDTPNAFVLSGKKIFVFTGILPIAGDDAGLATILGHEIAHQVVRHGAERLSQVKVLMALGYFFDFVMGVDIGITRIGLNLFLTLPNSRAQESEADRIGLRLMAQACFDPREAPQVWVRMTEMENKKRLGWLGAIDFISTHPSSSKRIKKLEAWTAEALDVRAASSCPDELSNRFEAFKDDVANRLSEPFAGTPTRSPSQGIEPMEDGRPQDSFRDPYAERSRIPGMLPPPRPLPQRETLEDRTKPLNEVDPVDEQWLKWLRGRKSS